MEVADVYVACAVSVHPGTAVFIVECLARTTTCTFLTDPFQVRGGFSTIAFLNQRTTFSVVASGNGSFRRRRGRIRQNYCSRDCDEQCQSHTSNASLGGETLHPCKYVCTASSDTCTNEKRSTTSGPLSLMSNATNVLSAAAFEAYGGKHSYNFKLTQVQMLYICPQYN